MFSSVMHKWFHFIDYGLRLFLCCYVLNFFLICYLDAVACTVLVAIILYAVREWLKACTSPSSEQIVCFEIINLHSLRLISQTEFHCVTYCARLRFCTLQISYVMRWVLSVI